MNNGQCITYFPVVIKHMTKSSLRGRGRLILVYSSRGKGQHRREAETGSQLTTFSSTHRKTDRTGSEGETVKPQSSPPPQPSSKAAPPSNRTTNWGPGVQIHDETLGTLPFQDTTREHCRSVFQVSVFLRYWFGVHLEWDAQIFCTLSRLSPLLLRQHCRPTWSCWPAAVTSSSGTRLTCICPTCRLETLPGSVTAGTGSYCNRGINLHISL